MKIYQVLLAIDTGYLDHVRYGTCVLYAESEEAAGITAKEIANKHLPGDVFCKDVLQVFELPVREGGIIYQNCYQEIV